MERRVGAVGLLWNRPSDAFLGMQLKAAQRNRAFGELEAAGRLVPVRVQGLDPALYALAQDLPLLEAVRAGRKFEPRTEFLAPLDAMLWDRKLIEALFGFAYRWEIYTPAEKRSYGHYVLPVLRGERFAGRIEAVRRGAGGARVLAGGGRARYPCAAARRRGGGPAPVRHERSGARGLGGMMNPAR